MRLPQRFNRYSSLPLTLILMLAIAATEVRARSAEEAKTPYREGNALFDQGRFREAVGAYDRALQQDPQYAEAYHNRALAHEMLDHAKALADWRRFVELAGGNAELRWDVARARARLQILESMPALPEAMQPSRYMPLVGDYYWQIADRSEGEEWPRLPAKVFLGSAPEIKWQEGAREAYNIWSAVFPLALEALPQRADIRIGWEESIGGAGHAGEEMDWVQIRRVGDQLTGRRIAVITPDLSRRWSKGEMRAIMLHEMGHALGIKGHSDSPKDIMYWQMQEKVRQIHVPVIPYPLFWKSLVKQPSQRDVNTLLRLYNSAGPSQRFR